MIASIDDVSEFARRKLREAREGSEEIPFHLVERFSAKAMSVRNAKEGSLAASISIVDDPRFAVLKHSMGQLAWAVVLSVDLRNSTWRAMNHGAEATYLTMHTYLPTMEYIVGKAGGKVIGLRGDGLFAGFGITECNEEERVFTSAIASKAASDSVKCGHGMIEAVRDVINPILEDDGVPDGLAVGVGIDTGQVVITRIGLDTANEVTAYGDCVNRACKRCNGNNVVYISRAVVDYYPTSDGGTVKFVSAGENGYRLKSFPYDVLSRGRARKAK